MAALDPQDVPTDSLDHTRRGSNRYHAVIPILTDLEHLQIELYQGFSVQDVLEEVEQMVRDRQPSTVTSLILLGDFNAPLRGASVAEILSAFPRLSSLHISSITIAEEVSEASDGSRTLRASITALSGLKRLVMEESGGSVLQGLQLSAGLEELDVRNCSRFDLASLRTLAMQARASLTTLTFISPAETSPFFPAFQLPHLSTLNIDAPLPFFVLSGFSSSPLRTIRCSRLHPEITDEDDEDFAALEQVMEENRASLKGLEVRLPETKEGDEYVWINEEAWERVSASCQRRGVQLKLGGQWWEQRPVVRERNHEI
ncbi:hypothetical protein BCR35DRAFT_352270 [Leucosporidium creatinivorum]|uniref:Uncharacterized protein n=1 Tax=Leucosporidium creatinivorum TaxID=106004 RepID=A0A1Y2FCX1_9BASI|nr:hypothetical protein BCR35DRAFT_352270 [Leucosporidium creatinivorum]